MESSRMNSSESFLQASESDDLTPKNKYPISISWPRNNKKRSSPPHRREQQQHLEQQQHQHEQEEHQQEHQPTSYSAAASSHWRTTSLQQSESLKGSKAMDLSGNASIRKTSESGGDVEGAVDDAVEGTVEGAIEEALNSLQRTSPKSQIDGISKSPNRQPKGLSMSPPSRQSVSTLKKSGTLGLRVDPTILTPPWSPSGASFHIGHSNLSSTSLFQTTSSSSSPMEKKRKDDQGNASEPAFTAAANCSTKSAANSAANTAADLSSVSSTSQDVAARKRKADPRNVEERQRNAAAFFPDSESKTPKSQHAQHLMENLRANIASGRMSLSSAAQTATMIATATGQHVPAAAAEVAAAASADEATSAAAALSSNALPTFAQRQHFFNLQQQMQQRMLLAKDSHDDKPEAAKSASNFLSKTSNFSTVALDAAVKEEQKEEEDDEEAADVDVDMEEDSFQDLSSSSWMSDSVGSSSTPTAAATGVSAAVPEAEDVVNACGAVAAASLAITVGGANQRRSAKKIKPDNEKDDNYWKKRFSNNKSAKRSRDKKREHEKYMEERAKDLTEEHKRMKAQMERMNRELAAMTELARQHGIDVGLTSGEAGHSEIIHGQVTAREAGGGGVGSAGSAGDNNPDIPTMVRTLLGRGGLMPELESVCRDYLAQQASFSGPPTDSTTSGFASNLSEPELSEPEVLIHSQHRQDQQHSRQNPVPCPPSKKNLVKGGKGKGSTNHQLLQQTGPSSQELLQREQLFRHEQLLQQQQRQQQARTSEWAAYASQAAEAPHNAALLPHRAASPPRHSAQSPFRAAQSPLRAAAALSSNQRQTTQSPHAAQPSPAELSRLKDYYQAASQNLSHPSLNPLKALHRPDHAVQASSEAAVPPTPHDSVLRQQIALEQLQNPFMQSQSQMLLQQYFMQQRLQNTMPQLHPDQIEQLQQKALKLQMHLQQAGGREEQPQFPGLLTLWGSAPTKSPSPLQQH